MALREKKQEQIDEDKALFLKNFPDPLPLPLEYFRPVQWPVVVSEAYVNIRSVQDFSVLSLLILRLFDAGVTDVDTICRISGMSRETVRAYVERELHLFEHIDAKTLELTPMGRQTLELNNGEGEKPRSCQLFKSAIRIHIEPVTVSLIPQYLEWERLEDNKPNEDAGDFVLPPPDGVTDEGFMEELNLRLVAELNERKEEHVLADSLKNGNVIDDIDSVQPMHIFFRWAYLAKFEGMRYPMLLLSGKITAENTNAHTKAAGYRRELVILPVNVSERDQEFLKEQGMLPERVLSRPDSCFERLEAVAAALDPILPSEESAEGAISS